MPFLMLPSARISSRIHSMRANAVQSRFLFSPKTLYFTLISTIRLFLSCLCNPVDHLGIKLDCLLTTIVFRFTLLFCTKGICITAPVFIKIYFFFKEANLKGPVDVLCSRRSYPFLSNWLLLHLALSDTRWPLQPTGRGHSILMMILRLLLTTYQRKTKMWIATITVQ